MKKLSLLLLACAAFSTGCKKDDNNGTNTGNPSNDIVGKWQLVKEVETTYENNQLTETWIYTQDSMDVCEKDDYIQFKSDKKYLTSVNGTSCYPQEVDGTGSYSINGAKLIVADDRYPNAPDTLNILTINGQEMKLNLREDDGPGNYEQIEFTYRRL